MTDEYSLTVRREIGAPAEELFDAWLDPQSLALWFKPDGHATRAEIDPRVGGTLRFVMGSDESSCIASGTYREIDRPHRLVFTWSSPDTRFRDSLVTVTFRPSSSSTTIVEIHQVGLPDAESRASHFAGWADVLRELGPSPSHEVGRQTSVRESTPATEDPDV